MAAGPERMTPTDTPQAHPRTLQEAVFDDRLSGVFRATRRVPAAGRHPRKSDLVGADHEDAKLSPRAQAGGVESVPLGCSWLHLACSAWKSCSASAVNSSNDRAATLSERTTTLSTFGLSQAGCRRRISRNRLFWVFRAGLPPIFFDVAIPINPAPGRKISRQVPGREPAGGNTRWPR